MKPWLKYTFWLLFLVGVGILMAFVNNKQKQKIVGLPEINIGVFEDMLFLTKEEVTERLSHKNLISADKTYSEIDIEKIEKEIKNMPEVKTAEVFVYVSGKWIINIELRKPIARIFNLDGSSCYLDEDGSLMPLSDAYTARVLTVNGYINEIDFSKSVSQIMNNDSLKTIEILDDLYAISSYVCSDEFLSAQITHVFVNQYLEFELIPRVGDQRILFGDANYVAGKFKKLEYFYLLGMSRAGWDTYDTINIMYGNAVFPSKR